MKNFEEEEKCNFRCPYENCSKKFNVPYFGDISIICPHCK